MASRKLNFMSSDGVAFEVDEIVALQWQTIKESIDGDFSDGVFPLPNVTSEILEKVIEFCRKQAECSESEDISAKDNLKAWNADFVKLDQTTLLHLLVAANYLNIQSLLDLTFKATADMIKDKSVEDVRQFFNITNDYTPEEEAEMRNEFPWAFE